MRTRLFTMLRRLIGCCGAALALSPTLAAQAMATDLATARANAVAAGKPMLMFFTGTDWDANSAAIVAEQLTNKRVVEALQGDHVLLHIDLLLRGQSDVAVKSRDQASSVLRQFGVWRHDQLPCVVLLDRNGRIRGRSLLLPGKPDRVLAIVRELTSAAAHASATVVDPARARDHVITGRSLLQQHKFAEARAEGMAAVQDDPTSAEAWDLLVTTSVAKATQLTEARAAVALSQVTEPDTERSALVVALRWSRLGAALAAHKRDAEAIFCYRQAMAIDRTNFAAGLAAAQLGVARKDLAGAVRDAEEVLRRDFGNVEALRIRSKCLPAKVLEGR